MYVSARRFLASFPPFQVKPLISADRSSAIPFGDLMWQSWLCVKMPSHNSKVTTMRHRSSASPFGDLVLQSWLCVKTLSHNSKVTTMRWSR